MSRLFVQALTTSSSKPMRRNVDNTPTPDHSQLQEKGAIWTFMCPGQMHHLWYVLAKIMSPNLIKLLTQRQIPQKCRGQRTCQIKLWNSNQPRPERRKFSRKTDPNSSGNKRHNTPPPTHTHPKKWGKTFTDGNPLNSMLAKYNGWILFGSWFE